MFKHAPRRSKRAIWPFLLAAVLSIPGLGYVDQIWLGIFGPVLIIDYPLHHFQMVHLVDQIEKSNLPMDQDTFWTFDSAGGITRAPASSWDWTYGPYVGARRTASGYNIAIVEHNEGHAGYFGYVYSDAPITNTDEVPGNFMSLDMPLGPHWWAASGGG